MENNLQRARDHVWYVEGKFKIHHTEVNAKIGSAVRINKDSLEVLGKMHKKERCCEMVTIRPDFWHLSELFNEQAVMFISMGRPGFSLLSVIYQWWKIDPMFRNYVYIWMYTVRDFFKK